jgi:16S rRNA (guanine966-N2)-methyltransferase
LRIIAGSAKGRRLATPARIKGRPPIRPTSDRAREALFSIIGRAVIEARVLDLFAGTGALGLEALSRGAAFALFVDRNQQAAALIRENIDLCGFAERARILQRDLDKGLAFPEDQEAFSLVFLDPPYGSNLAQQLLAELAAGRHLADDGLVVAEDAAGERLPETSGRLQLIDRRRYGDTGFWFYRYRKSIP